MRSSRPRRPGSCRRRHACGPHDAISLGATEEQIIDVLLAVAPVVGLARVTSAAPELALALGYDVFQAGT